MGNSLTQKQEEHIQELVLLVRQIGARVSYDEIKEVIQKLDESCPWYPEGGSLKSETWARVMREFQAELHVPVPLIITCHKICLAVSQVCPEDAIQKIENPLLHPPVAPVPMVILLPPRHDSKLPSDIYQPGNDPPALQSPPALETGCTSMQQTTRQALEGENSAVAELATIAKVELCPMVRAEGTAPQHQQFIPAKMLVEEGVYSPSTPVPSPVEKVVGEAICSEASKTKEDPKISLSCPVVATQELIIEQKEVNVHLPQEVQIVGTHLEESLPLQEVSIVLPQAQAKTKNIVGSPGVNNSAYNPGLKVQLPIQLLTEAATSALKAFQDCPSNAVHANKIQTCQHVAVAAVLPQNSKARQPKFKMLHGRTPELWAASCPRLKVISSLSLLAVSSLKRLQYCAEYSHQSTIAWMD